MMGVQIIANRTTRAAGKIISFKNRFSPRNSLGSCIKTIPCFCSSAIPSAVVVALFFDCPTFRFWTGRISIHVAANLKTTTTDFTFLFRKNCLCYVVTLFGAKHLFYSFNMRRRLAKFNTTITAINFHAAYVTSIFPA